MRIRTFILGFVALMAAMLAASPAFGAVLGTYEDRPTWNGVTTGITTDDFSSIGTPAGGYQFFNTSGGLTRGSINYVGVDGAGYTMLAINPTSGENYFGSGVLLRNADYYSLGAQYLQLTLPDLYSVGFDLGTAFPNAIGIRIELSTGEFYIRQTQNSPVLSFWGVQTNTPIEWIRLALTTGGTNNPVIGQSIVLLDNLSYGTVYTPPGGGGDPGGGGETGETPEAATLLMVASGFAFFLWRRKHVLSLG